jgi:hypothetical protein
MSKLVLSGDTSGSVTLESPAVSGTTTLTLPASTGTVVVTGGAQTIEFADGSASTPSITNSGDTNTGMFFPAADTIAFAEGGAEAIRIDSSGNVLVGSTSTTGRISSTSDGTFNADTNPANLQKASFVSYGNYGGGVTILDGTQGYVLYAKSSGADFYIRRGTTSSALTGGVALVNAATSWTSASDENVKDIIEPIENAIEKVSTLRTVIGKYKDEEEGIRHPFLIAQDVEKVLPEAISIMNKDSENECLGLSYTDVIPLLVAAIKEQQTIIETLKSDIAELKAKVNV